jgi:hypothetical protein
MRDNLGPRDLQNVTLKPGWREYGLEVVLKSIINVVG